MAQTKLQESYHLDPDCWQTLRTQAHTMLDETLDHIQGCRQDLAWRPMTDAARQGFSTDLPHASSPVENVYAEFSERIKPYTLGNIHPGFMGWVQGGGTVVGMLAEMLAGGLNANLGGRDQSPLEVEREVVGWMRQLFCFPETATGVFLTGSSIANFVAILIARNQALRKVTRKIGMLETGVQLTAYTSRSVHRCVQQAMDMAGIGSSWLRKIQVVQDHRIRVDELRSAIQNDIDKGYRPFCVIGCAGTVDTGAVDDLVSLRQIATDFGIALHIDGAFGALGMLSPKIRGQLVGIESADTIAFDFHKWTQVPYDAGFLLVRDGESHLASFENPADYLSRDPRALSAGSPWPCDLGPDLSRGFRALKTWMTLKVYGADRLGSMMENTCRVASYLADKIRANDELELLAPQSLNIVCFRYRCSDPDRVNSDVVAAIQRDGKTIPSSTKIDGKFAIRVAIFNHRTTVQEIDQLLEQVLHYARNPSDANSNASAA